MHYIKPKQNETVDYLTDRMDEREDLSGTHLGDSGLLLEFECTPCAADGSKLEAVHFCKICKHFLCKYFPIHNWIICVMSIS